MQRVTKTVWSEGCNAGALDGSSPNPAAKKPGSDSLERLVQMVVANHTPEFLALGCLRYEAVRRMSPSTFGELHKLNLSGKFFDSLVDEALRSWKQKRPRSAIRRTGASENL